MVLWVYAGHSPFSGEVIVRLRGTSNPGLDPIQIDPDEVIDGIGPIVAKYSIQNLPAETVLKFDGTREKIIADLGGVIRDGSQYVNTSTDGYPFNFPSASASCGDLVVCVYGAPSGIDSASSVTFQTIHREL